MQPLAIDAALLRAVLTPDLKLTVGRELMARVATLTGGGRGTLSLAGMLLDAELPASVSAGDELRLAVSELTPEKVVLTIQDESEQPAPQATPVEPPRVPLPQGGSLQVTERDAGGRAGMHSAGDQTHTLTLRYDAPSLGPIDMRFTLTPGALKLALSVAPAATTTVSGGAAELAGVLTAAAGRPASVTVSPRREPIEVYA